MSASYPMPRKRRRIVRSAVLHRCTFGLLKASSIGLKPANTAVRICVRVKDNGTPLTVAFSGGTEFNFVNDVPHFDTYINSAHKFAAAAAAADATILMTNQSEFDNAASKIRMLADP